MTLFGVITGTTLMTLFMVGLVCAANYSMRKNLIRRLKETEESFSQKYTEKQRRKLYEKLLTPEQVDEVINSSR